MEVKAFAKYLVVTFDKGLNWSKNFDSIRIAAENEEHVILDCPKYKYFANHPPQTDGVTRIGWTLDLDRPPPEKRKIALFIKALLKKRKKIEKSSMKN